MIGRRILYSLLLIGCFCFCIAYQKWLAWFLLAALLALPAFSLLVSLPAMLTTKLRLILPQWVEKGDWVDLEIYHRCPLPSPPWRFKVIVECPLTGEKRKLRKFDFLPTQHCGALLVRIKKARISDYFGLVKIPVVCRPASQWVYVRPKPIPVPDLPSLKKCMELRWKPKLGGGFAENHELRLYRPGDNIQQIHWKLSAKTGSLILREPMEPIQQLVLVRMDLKGSALQLDTMLGQLLWIGQQMIEKNIPFRLQCLTGKGLEEWVIADTTALENALDQLLSRPQALSGSLRTRPVAATWQYFIGGDSHEA